MSLGLLRLAGGAVAEQMQGFFTPGRVLQAEVLTVYQGRAVLAFGRGLRMEALLQVPLSEGDRVQVQVMSPQGGEPGVILLKCMDRLPVHRGVYRPSGEAPLTAGRVTDAAMNTPQPVWLVLPSPDGGQSWVQVSFPPDRPSAGGTADEAPAHAVHLYWESQELGTVGVKLETAGARLAALFTADRADSRTSIAREFALLARELEQAGYPAAQLGCRAPDPTRTVAPVRPASSSRVDRRI